MSGQHIVWLLGKLMLLWGKDSGGAIGRQIEAPDLSWKRIVREKSGIPQGCGLIWVALEM